MRPPIESTTVASRLSLDDVELGLAGPFQHENAAIAIAALEAMRAMGWNVGDDAIRRGMREVFWPGRFDIVSRKPIGGARLRA